MTWRLVRDDALQFVQLYLLAVAVVRGVDYLITPPGSSAVLYFIERAAPLPVWALMFITLGIVGIAGEWWIGFGASPHRWLASYVAHAALASVYTAVGVGALIEILSRQPIYGFRTPVEWLLIAAMHAIFVRRKERV